MPRTARAFAAVLAALVPILTVLGLASPAVAATDPDVIAHRGSSGAAPENTLAAVRLAIRHDSDVVENDVQRTRDGELVVIHDTTLDRTTDVEQVFPTRAPWRVADFTLEEIKRLDAGSWFAPRFAGQEVPTLEEWVNAVGRQAGMLLEPKSPALYPGIERDLDKELRSLPAFHHALRTDRVVVQSFDHTWLREYEDVAPDVPVGLLYSTEPTEPEVASAAEWAEQVNPALRAIDKDTVDLIHSYGLESHVWTVNAGPDMRRAIDWGVDGIITDYPQVLRDILRSS